MRADGEPLASKSPASPASSRLRPALSIPGDVAYVFVRRSTVIPAAALTPGILRSLSFLFPTRRRCSMVRKSVLPTDSACSKLKVQICTAMLEGLMTARGRDLRFSWCSGLGMLRTPAVGPGRARGDVAYWPGRAQSFVVPLVSGQNRFLAVSCRLSHLSFFLPWC